MRVFAVFALGIAVVWGNPESQAGQPSPDQVFTNKARFRIPYRFDAAEMQKLGAREIRLYVSSDRGGRWQHQQTVSPEAGRFEFEAPSDGEYWFAVRTLDADQRLHPQAHVSEPELRVVVDTTPPTLTVQLRQIEPGRVQLSWQAEDRHLNPRELQFEYLQPGEEGWQKVGIVPQSSGRTWWSVPDGGFVAVWGTASDFASNTATAQDRIQIVPAGQAEPRSRSEAGQPIALGGPDRETAPTVPRLAGHPALGRGLAASQPLAGTGRRPSDTENAGPPRLPPAAETERPQASPRTRVVNSRQFQINYRVDDVGPSGVSRVELFITEDGGRKWYKYGDDPDRQSPFDVEVPRDGTYGFLLRVHSGAGLAVDPPRAGDGPPIVVAVDQTPPSVELLPVQQGRGASMNRVFIRWKVSDENPAEKPVALSYASDRHGPWEPIGDWQADSGSYEWTVPAGLPPRLYVRLTARDAAGNISRAETTEPIVVDLTKPSARIVDVESIEVRR